MRAFPSDGLTAERLAPFLALTVEAALAAGL